MGYRWVWAVAGVVLAATGAADAVQCDPIRGPFHATLEAGPPCDSQIFLCTHGTLTGSLPGKYDFRMNSLAPALDVSDPQLLAFTGESLITARGGTMHAEDQGTLHYDPLGPSPFTTLVRIVSGRGAFAGASGFIVAEGTADFAAGTITGHYSGVLCLP